MIEQATKEAGHERRDISVRVIIWFAMGLVISGIAIHFIVSGLYKLFEAQHPSPDAPSRIELHPQMIAPQPQLQPDPQVDLAQYDAREQKQLHSYGWIDRNAWIAHIPIERAIDLIAQRGLPTRGPDTKNSSGITPEQLQQQKAAATAPKQP